MNQIYTGGCLALKNLERKTDSILVKVAPTEHEAIKKAAMILKMSKSEFVLSLARKKAEEVLAGDDFKHIQVSSEGNWVFKGRKLRVFTFYNMFKMQSEFDEKMWTELYDLSESHFEEAKRLCEYVEPQQFLEASKRLEMEDRELLNGEPY